MRRSICFSIMFCMVGVLLEGCAVAPPPPPPKQIYKTNPQTPPRMTVEEAKATLILVLGRQNYPKAQHSIQPRSDRVTWKYATGEDQTDMSSYYKDMGEWVLEYDDGGIYFIESGTDLVYTYKYGANLPGGERVGQGSLPWSFKWLKLEDATLCADAIWVLKQAASGTPGLTYFDRALEHWKAGRKDEATAAALKHLEHKDLWRQLTFGASNVDLYLDLEKRRKLANEAQAKAEEAEKAGNHLVAFNEYVNAFQISPDSKESKLEATLIGGMWRMYPKLAVKPELPELGRRFRIKAELAIREERYQDGINHLMSITPIAPWWPEARFNAAILYARLNNFKAAIEFMKQYLLLVPEGENARVGKDNIYEWEEKVK